MKKEELFLYSENILSEPEFEIYPFRLKISINLKVNKPLFWRKFPYSKAVVCFKSYVLKSKYVFILWNHYI